MQELKKLISKKTIDGVHLFYGEEQFVLHTYLDRMIKIALSKEEKGMNLDSFNEGSDIERMISAMNTLPFLANNRVVIIKYFGFFKAKNNKRTEKLLEALDQIPPTTVLIIVEQEVDKRTKFFKAMKKTGVVSEFKQQSLDDLVKYIATRLGRYDKKIGVKTAAYLVDTVGYDLSSLNNEIKKLIDYVGKNDIVYKHDIDVIVTKSIENRIFELVDSIGNKKKQRALQLFEDLIALREPPTRILYMITRQFRILLQIKLLSAKRISTKEIAGKIKQPSFVVSKCARQVNYFSVNRLKAALTDCLNIEASFKHGEIDVVVGVEMLIANYSQ